MDSKSHNLATLVAKEYDKLHKVDSYITQIEAMLPTSIKVIYNSFNENLAKIDAKTEKREFSIYNEEITDMMPVPMFTHMTHTRPKVVNPSITITSTQPAQNLDLLDRELDTLQFESGKLASNLEELKESIRALIKDDI
jgi:hypothetical protein